MLTEVCSSRSARANTKRAPHVQPHSALRTCNHTARARAHTDSARIQCARARRTPRPDSARAPARCVCACTLRAPPGCRLLRRSLLAAACCAAHTTAARRAQAQEGWAAVCAGGYGRDRDARGDQDIVP
eukprot:5054890-Prymnesium_polylepis.1